MGAGRHAVMPIACVLAVACADGDWSADCSPCPFEVAETTRVGTRLEAGAIDEYEAFVLTTDGRFLLTTFAPGDRIFEFDGEGDFLRQVGRTGSGPGELLSVEAIAIGRADSVIFADGGNRRLSFADSRLVFGRSISLPSRVYQLRSLPDGRMIAAFDQTGPEEHSPSLHLLSPDGQVVRSHYPGVSARDIGSLAVSDEGIAWVVHRDSLLLNRWNVDTGATEVLAVEAQ